jgi:PAS domain S-box-containing protein
LKNTSKNINSVVENPPDIKSSEHSQLLALFDNSTFGMVICNLEGRFLNVNNQFTKITGYSKEELYNITLKEVIHPDDFGAYLKLFNELLSGKRKSFQIDKRYLNKRKEVVWVNLLVSIVFNSANIPEAIIGNIEEITEKRQTIFELEKSKSELKKTLKLLKSIQDAIPDLIGVQDLNHTIIQYNQAGYDLLNKTYEEVVGRKCYELIGRTKPCKVCSTTEAIKSKLPSRHEQYFPELDNWLDMRSYPIFSEENEIIYIVEHLRDITEIKKLELQLKDTIENLNKAKLKAEESDNLKTAFLHNISHEIRTPMNGIIGYSDLLKGEGLSCEKICEYADNIINSGWKLSNIINDLVSIATIESGQEKANFGTTDINSLLKSIFSNFQIKARNKGIAFYIKNELIKLKYISTDETKLFEIISNLINNAINYTNEGYVEFGASIIDEKLQFYVRDTGIGIKKEDHDIIFKRFTKVNSNNNNFHYGSGLGLSICKAYVELLGGEIWLDSVPNVGTTFYFNISLMLEKENKDNHVFVNKIDGKTTLLIAEDDEINYIYFAEIVKTLDVKLLHVKNGFEAVEACKQGQRIDMIFMNLKMPVLNGQEAVKQIKSIKPEIPIIAVSGYFDEKEKKISKSIGCMDYLTKPVKKEDIIHCIQKVAIKRF